MHRHTTVTIIRHAIEIDREATIDPINDMYGLCLL